MFLGRVVGTVVATIKDKSLKGIKLLLVRRIRTDGTLKGSSFVAVDQVQAGVGDTVFLVSSREASNAILETTPPVDRTIVGIVDRIDQGKQL